MINPGLLEQFQVIAEQSLELTNKKHQVTILSLDFVQESLEVPQHISSRISFKDWLFREYYKPEFIGNDKWLLCFEIEARWTDFPQTGSYMDLLTYLTNNGACGKCQRAFKSAWQDYLNDG